MTLFTSFNKIIYRVLGPKISTQIAMSRVGKMIFGLVAGKSSLKTYEVDGIKINLAPDEASVFGIVYLGTINPAETKLVKSILKPGDTVIDIGAYVDGWYTLLAAKIVGQTGKVYSFEPVPKFYKRLKDNIALNNFTNIMAENVALDNKNGTKTFYQSDGNSSFFKTHVQKEGSKRIHQIKVKTLKLDSYLRFKKINKVDFIKIDVEGAELEVLRGAKSLLKGPNAPDLLIEVVDEYLRDGSSSRQELIQYLNGFGYRPHQQNNGSSSVNLFFLKQ